MPKGALLHAHLDATVNADTLLELALAQPAMHISVPAPLSTANLAATLPAFQPLSADELALVVHRSLTEVSYTANAWVPLAEARANFALELGGPAGFDRWVRGTLTINPTEAYHTHNTVPKVPSPRLQHHPLTPVGRSGKSLRASSGAPR
jgi:adenosine deaminase CECR1